MSAREDTQSVLYEAITKSVKALEVTYEASSQPVPAADLKNLAEAWAWLATPGHSH